MLDSRLDRMRKEAAPPETASGEFQQEQTAPKESKPEEEANNHYVNHGINEKRRYSRSKH